MKGKRRRHDPEFKARVALEAIKGVKTIQEIAKEFDVHPVQVSEWKKTMAQNAASAFGAGTGRTYADEFERESERPAAANCFIHCRMPLCKTSIPVTMTRRTSFHFRLTSPTEHLSAWISDYAGILGPMFFEETPAFEEMIAAATDFETTFNTTA